MKNTVSTANYFESHARKTFDSGENVTLIAAEEILKRIDKLEDKFTERDIYQRGWANVGRDSELISDALNLLEECGYIRKVKQDKSTGRPSKIWLVNPAIRKRNG